MGLDTNDVLEPREYKIVYESVLVWSYVHLAALYGLYLGLAVAKWNTLIFAYVLAVAALVGVTAGAHRLWSHRAYKATTPLQILLMLMNSVAYQFVAIDWIKAHRLHHKYSDTDADPHNASRGFFFCHIGWLLVERHPEQLRVSKTVDMSDIYSNPVLVFQKKYTIPVIGALCFVLPTLVPVYYWQESLTVAWHVTLLRYICTTHIGFCVNSFAHLYGRKPYDTTIRPRQNIPVAILTTGEGFHNYHHVFPWDYRAAELGNNWLNPTTLFIDFFAWVGWAYDMKAVDGSVIESKAKKSGDGSDLWGVEGRSEAKVE